MLDFKKNLLENFQNKQKGLHFGTSNLKRNIKFVKFFSSKSTLFSNANELITVYMYT